MKSIKPENPTFFEKAKHSFATGDIWSHLYGILGTVSLIFTIVYSVVSFRNHDTVEYRTVVLSLSIIVCVLIFTFVTVVAYYQRRLGKLNELPIQLHQTKTKNDRLSLMVKAQSECSHTINHYYRNIENQLDLFCKNIDCEEEIDENECSTLLSRCKYFLLNTSISLQNYYTIASGYTCSVTIKIALKDERGNHYVKTLFRDPLSLKKRRYVEASYASSSGVYSASENTAFDVILSANHVNNYYASNNLREEYERHNYKIFK